MKNFKKALLLSALGILVLSCNSVGKSKSSLTGWNYNDPRFGNYLKGNPNAGQETPPGMVAIEGGTFTMGQVQDDIMNDWNTTPKTMHVSSFYMDEAEVTNAEYLLYLQHTKDVFPPDNENYKHIYSSALPDTLVWRKGMANTQLLAENYLRNPAYADYPVVGVSWLQATRYCKWRTNAVNLRILIDKGVIRNVLRDSTRSFFDTDTYLSAPNKLFNGDSTVYRRGLPVRVTAENPRQSPQRGQFTGRHVTAYEGILIPEFRLPTEAEWEYAAKAIIENREYNTIRGRKKYPWQGRYTRDKSTRYKGDQLANFKQEAGNYSGIAGWSSDGADITIKVKSYPPNAFGLYDMAGNVNEWVADVYRPIIDTEASDFNYFRGNIFTKKLIDSLGRVVIVGESAQATITYDTLPNGKIYPIELPGEVKYIPITKDDLFMRRNYNRSNYSNYNDGDKLSTRFFDLDDDQFEQKARMYNSPINKRDSITGKLTTYDDSPRRSTLISDKTRVYKGGSWKDREYWLDPSQRRYLPEYMSSNDIGFRAAANMFGSGNFTTKKTGSGIK